MPPTHLLFVDDSGTKEYASNPVGYGSGNSRYFVFGGVLLPIDKAAQLAERIRSLKLAAFKTADVEIKSNWLRMPEERKARYLDRFKIAEDGLRAFTDYLYGAVCECDLLCLAGVVDKQHMQELCTNRPYYPPAVAYELLLQRAEQASWSSDSGRDSRRYDGEDAEEDSIQGELANPA